MAAVCGLLVAVQAQTPGAGAEITEMDVRRDADGLELNVTLRLELSGTLQEALAKGVPLIFLTEAELFRERWYWLDKRVGRAQRQLRLAYQPLTRRWRLSADAEDSGAALAQTFDSLDEALGVIRRVYHWKIADLSDLEPGARHRLEFRFRLDTTQLPRPLQIGTLGESDWALAVTAVRRLAPEPAR